MAANKKSGAPKNIAGVVRELVCDKVAEMGFELWDVLYEKEGASWYLRIIIDRAEGVDINDVEAVHRAVDPIIDEADPIEDAYYLEVSSAGVERELRLPEHFEAFIGEVVTVKLFFALDGKKELRCILSAYDAETDTLTLTDGNSTGEREYKLEHKAVARINVYYDFDLDKE